MKELLRIAGNTVFPDNRSSVYCGWYCRGVWQRKVEMAKVARNAPELGALGQSASPVAMTSAPRFCLSRAMVNLMQLQADDYSVDIHPLHNQNGRQTTQVWLISILYIRGTFTNRFRPGSTSRSSWTPLRSRTPFPKSKRLELLRHLL